MCVVYMYKDDYLYVDWKSVWVFLIKIWNNEVSLGASEDFYWFNKLS